MTKTVTVQGRSYELAWNGRSWEYSSRQRDFDAMIEALACEAPDNLFDGDLERTFNLEFAA